MNAPFLNNLPFLVCIVIGAACMAYAFWFFQDTAKVLKTVAQESAKTDAMVYVKGFCLIAIAVGTTFKEVFQPVTKEMMEHFLWSDWVIHFSAPVLSGLAVLAAFIDQSFSKKKPADNNALPPPPPSTTPPSA